MSSTPSPTPDPNTSLAARIGPDWAAVLVAALLVALAIAGLLPSIPFLVK
jgi:hypothetical protein